MGMQLRCRLDFEYATEEQAEAILRSVAVDNGGFITSRREGRRLVSEAQASTPLSLLHTLEDYLACVAVAERIVQGRDGGG